MNNNSFCYLTFLAVFGAAAPMTATAADVSVSRCNFDAQSVHKPALWITVDGVRTLYKVDENDLTRRIIYDDKRAESYARSILGLADAAVEVQVVDTCIHRLSPLCRRSHGICAARKWRW